MEPRDDRPPWDPPQPGPWSRSRPPGPPRLGGRPSFRFLARPAGLALGPGLPWPVVSVAATVAVVLLAWLLLDLQGLGGLLFPLGFGAACVAAVCAVRADQLFVPAAQAPVVAVVGIVGAAVLTGRTGSTTALALAVVAPLAELFWWLLVVSVVCAVIGVVRSGRVVAPGGGSWSSERGLGARWSGR